MSLLVLRNPAYERALDCCYKNTIIILRKPWSNLNSPGRIWTREHTSEFAVRKF